MSRPWMHRAMVVAAVSCGLLLSPAAAQAEPVGFVLKGFVGFVNDNGIGLLNEPFTSFVSFDTDDYAPNVVLVTDWIIHIPGAGIVLTTSSASINIEPGVFDPGDSYQIVDPLGTLVGQINGFDVKEAAFNFQDHDGDQLAELPSGFFDPAFLGEPLDLAEWELANGTLFLDDGNAVQDISFDILSFELSAPAALEGLAMAVADLGLPAGLETSLLSKLETALARLTDENPKNDGAGANALQAFINAVRAQRGKKIAEADADALIAAAEAILANL